MQGWVKPAGNLGNSNVEGSTGFRSARPFAGAVRYLGMAKVVEACRKDRLKKGQPVELDDSWMRCRFKIDHHVPIDGRVSGKVIQDVDAENVSVEFYVPLIGLRRSDFEDL